MFFSQKYPLLLLKQRLAKANEFEKHSSYPKATQSSLQVTRVRAYGRDAKNKIKHNTSKKSRQTNVHSIKTIRQTNRLI